MMIVQFLRKSPKANVSQKEFVQFSRWEYESHLKNVCNLLTDNEKPNMRMLQVPFCVNLWNVTPPLTLHSYSLSQTNRGVAIFNYAKHNDAFGDVSAKNTSHQHNYYEFIYVYQGSYSHTMNGHTYHYRENQCLMLEPGIYHDDMTSLQPGCTIIFFCVSRTFFETLHTRHMAATSSARNASQGRTASAASTDKSEAHFSVYEPLSQDSVELTRTLIEQLISEIVQNQIGCELVSEGLFYRLIGFLYNKDLYSCEQKAISFYEQERLNTSEELQAYLWSRNGQATRKEITEQFNYCADYLNRLLKRQTGWTISKYNQHIALKRAEQMLCETDMSVAEIIAELGFENKSFFYRLFEQNSGMTPSKYRLRHVKGETA